MESIRALQVARHGAVKARTQAGNQLGGLIVTAPGGDAGEAGRSVYAQGVTLAARFRSGDPTSPAGAARAAVVRRHQALTAANAQLGTALETLAGYAAPASFLARKGVSTQVAATLLVTHPRTLPA